MKTLCAFDNCKSRIAKIVGDCKSCDSRFCLVHRLPEMHRCVNMADIRKQAFEANETKLINEAQLKKSI